MISELENLIKKSRRTANAEWLAAELRACTRLPDVCQKFLDLKLTEKKYTNPNSSSIAYLIGITDVEPISYPLSLKIDKGRNDYPDIDLDFEDRRRNEVKQYLKTRWGEKNVASIATYGEFKAKGLVKDVARVLGCPTGEAMSVTQHFDTLEKYKESDKLKEFRKRWPEIEPIAKEMNTRIRQTGFHAAGVVISNRPLDEVAPLETRKDPSSEDRIEVVAYDMNDCQKIGLIKLDALGLNTLSVIHDCYDAIKERHSVDVWDDSLDLSNPRVYTEFNLGNTVGVFQTESSAYKRLIINMGIDNFTDLAASNGLVRPGAQASQSDLYIERKRGRVKTTYLSPILEEITKETYGTFIYQEQVMEICVKLAGFTWSEADKLRKIIGKKLDESEFEVWRTKFVEGASKHIRKASAEKMFGDFVKFAGYAFVKAHSYAYSVLSYQTMWLKVHYPTEFMWALIKNEGDAQNRATYLLEARRLGIEIKAPDVNSSDTTLTLSGNSIQFGLGEILGVGPAALLELMKKRPFSSVEELQERCLKSKIKTTCIEVLDKVGALESLGHVSEYEHQRYYYSLLNYPIDINMLTDFDGKLSKCVDFIVDENKIGFIKAIVKSTKRKDNYFRIEFEDDTASFAVFGDLSMEIKPGDFLLALVGDRAIYSYIEVYDIPESKDNPMLQFLSGDSPLVPYFEAYALGAGTLNDKRALVHILGVAKFKTKKGADMATVVLWDGTDIVKAVVFPQMYGVVYFELKAWNTVIVALEITKDGSLAVTRPGILKPEDYIKLKRK